MTNGIAEPKIQRVPHVGRGLVKLLAYYSYYSPRIGRRVKIYSGFIFNGASIPRCFWPLVGHPLGAFLSAALIHDYLYRVGLTTRKKSDLIFFDILTKLEIPSWKRKAMYRFVRLFAWRPWRNYRKLDPQIKSDPNMIFIR